MNEPSEDALRERYGPRLLAEADERRAASSGTAANRKPVELDQQSVGRLSRMDALQQQAMATAQDTRRRGRLKAIDAALRRLDDGDFGWCADCGTYIGTERLDLDPLLVRCVDCAR